MRVILFSRFGIHFENSARGMAYGIYVPSQEVIRSYGDIEHTTAAILERTGDTAKVPLWQAEHGQVVVYGELLSSLKQRRHAMKVYLPQEFVPESCKSFYFVFGDRWIVHGTKIFTDEGDFEWGISRIDVGEDNIVDLMVQTISEQMLDGEGSDTIIAVHENDVVYASLKDEMKKFELEVAPFATLKPNSNSQALYQHRDNSLLMLTFGVFAMLLAITSAVYWIVNSLEHATLKENVNTLRMRIQNVQINERLGHIRDPHSILNLMKKPLKKSPSAILHGAAKIGSKFGRFGEIDAISFHVEPENPYAPTIGPKELHVKVKIKEWENVLLLDQEILAQSLVEKYHWLRRIERPGDQPEMKLIIQVSEGGQ